MRSRLTLKKTFLLLVLAFSTLSSYTLTSQWVWTESKSMGYKIEFPQTPEDSVQVVDSPIGKLKLNIKTYEVGAQSPADENLLYLVNCTVFPDSVIKAQTASDKEGLFRKTIDGAVKNIGGKIIEEKKIELKGGYPGRELKIDFNSGNAIIFMRLYLVKNKLFLLETITQTNKAPNASITRFFNSFQLLL